MGCFLSASWKFTHFLRFYDLILVIGMHFPLHAAVSPNSPEKLFPLPCPLSKFAYTDENGDTKCRRCSYCPKGSQTLVRCNTYNDTECESCPSGWYNDVSGSDCKPCSGCKPGEYIRRECSLKRNTTCRECPRDMISVNANSSRCVPCRTCARHEDIISKCNGTVDITCGECKKGYFRESSTGHCLLCSHCPAVLQHQVVPECRDKLGLHHPDICWPNYLQSRFPNFSKKFRHSEDATRVDQNIKVEAEQEPIPLVFVFVIIGTIMLSGVILVSAFICFRQTYFTRSSNISNPSPLYEEVPSIPMSTIYVDRDNSECSDDSGTAGHSKPENTSIPSRTWSVPAMSSTGLISKSLKATYKTDRHLFEHSEHPSCHSQFHDVKIHGTL